MTNEALPWWEARAAAEAEASKALAEKAPAAKAPVPAAIAKHVAGATVDAELDAELDAEATAKAETLRRLGAPPDEIARQTGPLAPPKPTKADIERQLADLHEMRRSNPKLFWSDEIQKEQLALIEMQQRLQSGKARPATEEGGDSPDPGEILAGLPDDLRAEWRKSGGERANLSRAQETAQTALDSLDAADAEALAAPLDGLDTEIQHAAMRFMALPSGGVVRPVSDGSLEAFAALGDEAKALVGSWGAKAGERLGSACGKLEMAIATLAEEQQEEAHRFIGSLTPAQRVAVIKSMAGL
jgi:hypothetical protein